MSPRVAPTSSAISPLAAAHSLIAACASALSPASKAWKVPVAPPIASASAWLAGAALGKE